ncbi:Rad17-domain-containing protein [Hysterangium stoloniferum]|nr:Rad17-domain-containing protein [Hysterangium stoloniferum]
MPTQQIVDDSVGQLWVDRYAPEKEGELAVHKKKVEEVRHWLDEALNGGPTGILKKYRRILGLTGHAGSGKTATLRMLANEMGFEIIEWRNSLDDTFAGDSQDYGNDRESLANKFDNFLTRAASCRALPIFHGSTTSGQPSRQVILLEDLPNILHPETADAFHAALENYITSSFGVPLVCIISDSGVRGEDPDSDMSSRRWGRWRKQAIDIRSVIPPLLFNSPYFQEIQFNPIAPTIMTKALSALLTKHFANSKKSKTSLQPSKETVQIIVESSNGDIRSAIMALEFACVLQVPKVGKNGAARALLEAVTRREQSLALFHLMGKVLYNKRKGDPPNSSATAKERDKIEESDGKLSDPPPLPSHLVEHARQASRVDVNALYADSPVDTSLFSLYLHQNYTQFCDDIEDCDKICDLLSWIDSSGSESWQAQQSPHRFHILTLGTLHALPSPVPRRSQKIFKPEFFDALKKTREAEGGLIDTENWLNVIAAREERVRGWSKDEIILEMGSALKVLDSCGAAAPPQTHRHFSTLSFIHPAKMPGGLQRMRQLGESEEPSEYFTSAEPSGLAQTLELTKATGSIGGWLETDEIQDF